MDATPQRQDANPSAEDPLLALLAKIVLRMLTEEGKEPELDVTASKQTERAATLQDR